MTSSDRTEVGHMFTLMLTGLAMGVVHVLAGVDHLSALATLSVGSSWRALKLGIRWGLGHSAGLVLVTAVFLLLKGEVEIASIKRYCDGVVGFFMIVLGIYSIYWAVKTYIIKRDVSLGYDQELDMTQGKSYTTLMYKKCDPQEHTASSPDIEETSWSYWNMGDMKNTTTQKLLAFLIGIVHGVAGPGGMLGVIPAIEMKNWYASVLYLTSFVVSSTICMGAFAAVFGEVTKRAGSTSGFIELLINICSSALSIIVGITWITLSVMGKLDELFE